MCAGPAEVGFGEFGVELNGLGGVFYRKTVLFELELTCCSVAVESGDGRVECDGKAVLVFGRIVLASDKELVAFILKCLCFGLLLFDGKSDVLL